MTTARQIAEKWFRCDRPGPCRQEGITTPAHERIHVEGVDRLTTEITKAVVDAIWFNYDLTKAAAFMNAGGWRLRTHVLTVGPVGFAFIWKKRKQ